MHCECIITKLIIGSELFSIQILKYSPSKNIDHFYRNIIQEEIT